MAGIVQPQMRHGFCRDAWNQATTGVMIGRPAVIVAV
jgi:hypothetical protein